MAFVKNDSTSTKRMVTIDLDDADFKRFVSENTQGNVDEWTIKQVRLRTIGGSAPSDQWNMLANFEFQVYMEKD